MDENERKNWQLIKDKMEESGNTDNYFYKRACLISKGEPDPMNLPKFEQD